MSVDDTKTENGDEDDATMNGDAASARSASSTVVRASSPAPSVAATAQIEPDDDMATLAMKAAKTEEQAKFLASVLPAFLRARAVRFAREFKEWTASGPNRVVCVRIGLWLISLSLIVLSRAIAYLASKEELMAMERTLQTRIGAAIGRLRLKISSANSGADNDRHCHGGATPAADVGASRKSAIGVAYVKSASESTTVVNSAVMGVVEHGLILALREAASVLGDAIHALDGKVAIEVATLIELRDWTV